MSRDGRVLVEVPADKVARAVALAEGRNGKQARFGAMTHGGRRGSLEAHLIGILGELAVAEHFGVGLDETVWERHGDAGADLTIPGYGRVEVKTTTYLDKPLLRVEAHRPHETVDTYFACAYNRISCQVWILGYAPRDEVVKKTPRKLMARGPMNYILDESELRRVPAKERV